jgi:OmpA-OmpF porin, OOP family
MMKKTVGLAAALLLGTVSVSALADPTTGLYGTVGAGVSFVQDITPHEQPNETSDVATTTSFKTGFRTTAALGWGFGNGLRSELEVGYAASDVDTSFLSNNGRITQFTVMGNMLYDFDTGTAWTPHVGAGIGIGDDRIGGMNTPVGIQPIDVHSHVFTYQAIAGIEYAIAPQLKLGVDYRYLGSGDVSVSPGSVPASPHGADFNIDSHNILLTLRLDFGSPPPPPAAIAPPPPTPMPAPAPAPHVEVQRAFQVFFDFNKSDITAAAAKVIQAAADNVKAGHVTQIVVTGHTDTVGSAQYNQGLSERRAAAVRTQLVADGVAANGISTRGVGKTGLLVPTADGVREAQNRRAEIVLQ